MLEKKAKDRIIAKFRTHESDTGSPQVQVAILTEEIKRLTAHLKEHKQDHSSRRGLLKKVGERRRLLRYLERENLQAFEQLVTTLKIKISRRKMDEMGEEAELLASAAAEAEAEPAAEKKAEDEE